MGRVLVIESDTRVARRLVQGLESRGATAEHAETPETGWSMIGDGDFSAVLAGPREGASIMRRARTTPVSVEVHLICDPHRVDAEVVGLGPRSVCMAASIDHALGPILADTKLDDKDERALLERCFAFSVLGGELDTQLARCASVLNDAFGTTNCVMWRRDESATVVSAHPVTPEAIEWCATAIDLRTNVFDGAGRSYAAAALRPPGIMSLGGVCLISNPARLLSPAELRALGLIADRLGAEVFWSLAHYRLVEEHEALREAALLDPLTGLWARAAFEQAVSTEIAAARRREESLSLAIFDVMELRHINDRFGHAVGDEAIAHIARTLRANLRAQDIVGRFGGDELAVLLSGANAEQAKPVVTELVDTVSQAPLLAAGVAVAIHVTAGLTEIRDSEQNGESAFNRAFKALRQARRTRVSLMVGETAEGSEELADELVGNDAGGLRAGSTLGGMYRVLHELSRGAMGVVYRGEDMGLGRPVAIKLLRFDLAQDKALVARFRGEAAMLASLHHPHLVQVFSFAAEGDEVYFVMELVEGQALSDVLLRLEEAGEHLQLEIIIQIVDEISDALETMHAVGLIHRDVKPANVLLDQIKDRAVLVDVGVAKRRGTASDAAGTPGYAAPESFTETNESSATDVYGLAATVYMMLTGHTPYGSGEVIAVIERQLYDRPDAPSKHRPGLTRAVDDVVLKALRPEQRERYSSAGAFAVALSSALKRAIAASSGSPEPVRRRSTAEITQTRLAVVGDASEVDHTVSMSRALVTPEMIAPTVYPDEASSNLRGSRAHLGLVRGAVFRVAHKLLEHHLGSAWIRRTAERSQALGAVLHPTLSPNNWQPLERLITLLQHTAPDHPAPERLAFALGRATMSVTLARFFGADPSTVGPGRVLKAAESYWARYFTWGAIRVTDEQAGSSRVSIGGDPGDPIVCAMVTGALARIVELAGGRGASADVRACVCDGDPACVFDVSWETAAAANSSFS